jgi:hypothetical protein
VAIRNAQLAKPIVYYFSNPSVYGGTGEIIQGMPEEYAAPPGFEKVVCRSTAEAERWSGRMRVWEKAKEEIAQAYQRKQEEVQFKSVLSDFDHKIANARNNINRDFLIQARANAVKRYEDRYAMTRESFLHSEAYSADDKSVKTPKVRLPNRQYLRDIADFE